jgi:hypothetical protein
MLLEDLANTSHQAAAANAFTTAINGTQGNISSLLVQPSGLSSAPSISSSNEALDPNDFPALGFGPTSNPNPGSTTNGLGSGTTSQAGAGV